MSSKIRSGRNSSALWTASNPSAASPMICHSGFSYSREATNLTKGSKSSTRRILALWVTLIPCLLPTGITQLTGVF